MPGKVITIAQQKGGAGKTTLAINLGVALTRLGFGVALVDTDPQGSLGRWFMTRIEALGEPDLEFATSSAWGVTYECQKLAQRFDFVILDTPPKADSDLRPALRAADLVLVPVATSLVDLWATEGVLDLASRERIPAELVMTRGRPGTRLGDDVSAAAVKLGAEIAPCGLANRVAFAESLGKGMTVVDGPKSAARAEVQALTDHILVRLGATENS